MSSSSLVAPPQERLFTGQDLLAMADHGRYELIEGKLVPMSPTRVEHGRLESRLNLILGAYVAEHNLGELMVGEVGVYIRRNPDTIRAADLLFISHERLAQATANDFLDVAPELIIEIMSPSDRWAEIRRKLRDYFAAGVTLVMVIEWEDQLITLFRSSTEMEELTMADTLTLPDILPGFNCPVAKILTL
jgi:Uma2 family endonuclease